MNHLNNLFLFFVALLSISLFSTSHAKELSNPCSTPFSLLVTMDRPTAAVSPCTAPQGKLILEGGYQYQALLLNNGFGQNYPDLEARLGLSGNTELTVLLPNVYQFTTTPHFGTGAVTLGLKHEFAYTEKWIFSANGYITPPSGSDAFGQQGLGASANAIINYNITPQLGLDVLIGVSTQTLSMNLGGKRFNSFNPIVVLNYIPNSKLSFYGEIYGQSKVSPDAGSGFIFDTGVIYLVKPTVAVDLEYGHRLHGYLNNIEQYVGSGFTILL